MKNLKICVCGRSKKVSKDKKNVLEAIAPDSTDIYIGAVLMTIVTIGSAIVLPGAVLFVLGAFTGLVLLVGFIRLMRGHTLLCALRGAVIVLIGSLGKLVSGFSF